MRLVYLCGVVLSATALGAGTDAVASATAVMSRSGVAAPVELARNTDEAPPPSGPETPFEEGEQTSDPTEESKGGEERPESTDGETPFVDARYLATFVPAHTRTTGVGATPSVSQAALVSQYQPDSLERPPRA